MNHASGHRPSVPRRPASGRCAGVVLLFLALLAAGPPAASARPAASCTVVSAPPAASRSAPKPSSPLLAAKQYDVTFVTNCGSFTIRLDQAQSPQATASFVSLVQHKFFDHTIFHRIVPGFVIQGGDPTASGQGGPGYSTVDTPPSTAAYTHGVVAMAKTAAEPAGTAGSQFFVVTSANAGLPADYAIIGTVTKGLAVVDQIGTLGDASEQPTQVVEIESATVNGGAAGASSSGGGGFPWLWLAIGFGGLVVAAGASFVVLKSRARS